MSAKPRGRAFKMAEGTLVEAISAWREAYETDPMVTHYTIAEAIGVTQPTVTKRVARMGWVVPDDVASARKNGHKNKRSRKPDALVSSVWQLAAPGGKPVSAERGDQPAEAKAPASVWQFADGKRVTTTRQDGRHVEVEA